jgi:hypothetical protein
VDARASASETGSGALTEPPRPQKSPPVPELEDEEGLEQEISTLREYVRTMFTNDDMDVRLAIRAMDTLIRAVVAQRRLSPRSNKGLFARYAAMLAGFEHQLAIPPEPPPDE